MLMVQRMYSILDLGSQSNDTGLEDVGRISPLAQARAEKIIVDGNMNDDGP